MLYSIHALVLYVTLYASIYLIDLFVHTFTIADWLCWLVVCRLYRSYHLIDITQQDSKSVGAEETMMASESWERGAWVDQRPKLKKGYANSSLHSIISEKATKDLLYNVNGL